MIPKKIHYCWFGRKPLSKQARKCINSWKKYCSDYEIIEWNEDNFDINMNPYTKMCYETKKYAFLSDYARLFVINEYGGIYFDTDVEVIRSFDDLLNAPAFFGFETEQYVASGLGFGAEPKNSIVQQMIKEYDLYLDGQHNVAMCPKLNTKALVKFGLRLDGKEQVLNDGIVYPVDYFNPMSSTTGLINITKNTHSIHKYSMSWLPKHKQIKSKITQQFHRIWGVDCFSWLKQRNTK